MLQITVCCFHQSTLEEVVKADLVIHVIDGASPYQEKERAAVLGVLRQIGMSGACLEERLLEVGTICLNPR